MIRLPLRAAIAFVVALLAFAASSGAVPVNYDESVSGDLRPFNPLTLFTLDIGINTIKGTVSAAPPPVNPDFDSFAFTVPDGMLMTGGNIVLTTLTGNFNNASWYLGTGTAYGGQELAMLLSRSPGSVAIPAIPAGPYNMGAGQLGGAGSGSYTFTLNVIPEPASLSLLALGVIPLLRRSRRSVEKSEVRGQTSVKT